MRVFLGVFTAALTFCLGFAANAERRLKALVIGNDAYQNVAAASSSVANAEEMGAALGELGFAVTQIVDGDAITLWQRIAAFSASAAANGPDAVNLLYFSGRTAVEGGETYLLPIDTDFSTGIASRAISLNQVISLTAAGGGAVYVVLDLVQATEAPNAYFGAGQITGPAKGLVAIIERPADADPEEDAAEAFAITFSDEVQLPNLRMGPFIEFAAQGAQTYSGELLQLTFIRGNASDVRLNTDVAEDEIERLLQLRAYDISRTGSAEELAAFSALYPDFAVEPSSASDAPQTAEQIQAQQPLLRPVTFLGPLSGAGEPIEGLAISEIIKLKPKHSPLEGLPNSAWEDRTCSNCHKWNQAALCEHGMRYQGDIWNRAKVKDHPLGGAFKRVLRAWAADGCLTE